MHTHGLLHRTARARARARKQKTTGGVHVAIALGASDTARKPGRNGPEYADRCTSVWIVSPYVAMLAVTTEPNSSLDSVGGATETPPRAMSDAYTFAQSVTRNATSFTPSPWSAKCRPISSPQHSVARGLSCEEIA